MKKVLVIGLGISGLAVVDYLLKRGHQVVAIDKKPKSGVGCEVFPDDHVFDRLDFDLVVVSPGVSPTHPLYRQAILEGVELVGEAELALRAMNNKIVGVTGSNGKSTTTMLIAHILNRAGYRARPLGNIGTALISAVDSLESDEIVVAELSSFQLETMTTKLFDISMILNLTPNHLDRHQTMENYFLAKRKIGELVKEGGFFGVDKECAKRLQGISYSIVEECVVEKIPKEFRHLAPNIAFARFACLHLGLTDEEIFSGLLGFQCLPHRLEFVGRFNGVSCYNDSKATTMEAVSYAVKTIGENIVLIAGGRHKGGSFSVWNESFLGKVKAIILLGEAKNLIASELCLNIPIYFVDSLDEAIEKGLQVAKQGDNLVLSPGCASFDMFLNFEQRGELFKQGLERESKRYSLNFSSC